MDHMNEITPLFDYLSVSGCLPVNKKVLLKNGYTGAVCCVKDFEYEEFPPEIDYMHVKVDDTRDTDLTIHFDDVCDLIERQRKKGGRTLVFCGQGVSRSVSFCLVYMLKHLKMPLNEAYDYIRMRRPVVCPNVGFFKQLIALEKQEIGKSTVKIIRPAPELEVADIVWRRSLELLKSCSAT